LTIFYSRILSQVAHRARSNNSHYLYEADCDFYLISIFIRFNEKNGPWGHMKVKAKV